MNTKIPFENNVRFGLVQPKRNTKKGNNILPFVAWLAAVITVAWITFGSVMSG